MKFTILRVLTHSELGMFHEYRRQGKERAKQRAINFDWDVVDRVFPAAKDSDSIAIDCRRLEAENEVITVASWLKRQHKNWRFEGDCPTTSYYGYVDPGVLFAMVVDAATTPATASWVVIPLDHPARAAILNHGESARLGQSAMIALHDEEGAHCRAVLTKHFPQLFAKVESMSVAHPPPATQNNEVAPDPLGLFKILARAGHSLPSAVADLVDNSLSHNAKEIDITFPNPNEGGRWMCIRDNGDGMTPAALRDAMKVGYQREYGDAELGKFGYGLKGAAWSQADRLTVVSRAAGNACSLLTWDKDHLARTRRWELLDNPVAPEHEAAVDVGKAGTAVLLTQMRPGMEPVKGRGETLYALELAAIKDHLELIFHRFLEGKVPGREKVVIRLNGEVLRPNNPMGHPLTRVFEERRIEIPVQDARMAVLTVRANVTPNEAEFDEFTRELLPVEKHVERNRLTLNGRANDAQGFYFYRLNRLIKWGGWEDLFAKDEHTKLLRVAVDFDRLADEQLQVDISKQVIRLPLMVTDLLKDILKTPRAEARARYEKKVRTPDKITNTESKTTGNNKVSKTNKEGTTSQTSTGGVANGGTGKTSGGGSALPKSKKPLRVVDGNAVAWERKAVFNGEEVEITKLVPQLVTLFETIEQNNNAMVALSEFLRVLENAGVPKLLSGKNG